MKLKLIAAAAAAFPLAAFLCFTGRTVQAQANSAPPYWEGIDASGAIVGGEEDCPVEVEKEVLNLKIPTLPCAEDCSLSAYEAHAEAQYTFYNPTAATVNMKLLFPFGNYPAYLKGTDTDDKTAVTVNGENAECTVRYSYSAYGNFDVDTDMARIRDEKKTDAFYREDKPVREYTCTVDVPADAENCYLKFFLPFNAKKTRVLFPAENYASMSVCNGDAYACVYLSGTGEKTVKFYAAGDALAEVGARLCMGDAASVPDINVSIGEEVSFSAFALAQNKTQGVGEVDFYNAFLDMLNERGNASPIQGSVSGFSLNKKNLLRWFEYHMSIPAGERVVNTVCAPLYPAIEGNRAPRYEYSYLLSPAGKWADFKRLEINIDTPYFLSDSSLDFTRENADGAFRYRFTRSSLPQGELTFVLTEKEITENDFNFKKNLLFPTLTWAFVTLTCLMVVAAVVAVIVVVSLRKKKK